MKRILLFGFGPLPQKKTIPLSAGVLRTWQFSRALQTLTSECEVIFFLLGGESMQGSWTDVKTFLIAKESPHLRSTLLKIVHQKSIAEVVGVNILPAFLASKWLPKSISLWADLNGWIMAEMQAQSFELGHTTYLPHGWAQEKTVLLRADQISTVSTAQKYAVYGELAALGRIHNRNFGKDFVHVIPNISSPQENDKIEKEVDMKNTNFLRGKIVPTDAFVITQISGFNNWVDEENLFFGLTAAIEKEKNIHFVSTGGVISHIAERPFQRFVERVESSPWKAHFHLLGWIAAEKIPTVYQESDLGIMVDRQCLETMTGARNRLNEMLAFGLPILATRGSEISADIERWECGYIVESGKSSLLSAAILFLMESPQKRKFMVERGYKICETLLTAEKTVAPLLRWLQKEKEVPRRVRTNLSVHTPWQSLKSVLVFWRERGGKAFWKKLCQRWRERSR